jgi:hypothetical protein
MRGIFALIGIAALLLIGAMSLGLVNVQQTQQARLPSMALQGGQAPAFKADVANVTVGTEEKTVKLPTVALQEQKVAVPAIKIDRPTGASTTEPAQNSADGDKRN